MSAGRPKKEIDLELLQKLCEINCTQTEIAHVFGVSIDTVEARLKEKFDINFPEYYKRNSVEGKISLRRTQFKVALEKENVAMLIFLGKNYLGQSDHNDNTDPDNVRSPVNIYLNGKPNPKDLDLAENDNLEISRGSS